MPAFLGPVIGWVGDAFSGLFNAAYKASTLIFLALWRGEKGKRVALAKKVRLQEKQLEIANRRKLRRDELLKRMRGRKRRDR